MPLVTTRLPCCATCKHYRVSEREEHRYRSVERSRWERVMLRVDAGYDARRSRGLVPYAAGLVREDQR